MHLGSQFGYSEENIRFLRQMGVTVPILAVTGHAEDWDEEDLHDLGFNAILRKPFDTAELMPVVQNVLASDRQRGRAEAGDTPA